METDGKNGNRRFLLERITTDRNGQERICSAAATTILAEPRESFSLLNRAHATVLVVPRGGSVVICSSPLVSVQAGIVRFRFLSLRLRIKSALWGWKKRKQPVPA
jgi:hypothetical protein